MERFASMNDTSNCFLFLPLQPNTDAEAFNAVSGIRRVYVELQDTHYPWRVQRRRLPFFGHGDFSGMDS
jgi:hypothetical protein